MNHKYDICEFMRNLPEDVIYQKIIPFTYLPQNTELLKDIENFVKSKKIVLDIYEKYFDFDGREEYKHWLLNNLDNFINHNVPTFSYLTQHYIGICKRHFNLKNKSNSQVVEYVKYLEKKTYPELWQNHISIFETPTNSHWHRSFNFIWGLLTCEERREFIDNSHVDAEESANWNQFFDNTED